MRTHPHEHGCSTQGSPGNLVTVLALGQGDDAMAILRRYGAYDKSTRGDVGISSAMAGAGASAMMAHGMATEVGSETWTMEVPVEREQVVSARRPARGATADETSS